MSCIFIPWVLGWVVSGDRYKNFERREREGYAEVAEKIQKNKSKEDLSYFLIDSQSDFQFAFVFSQLLYFFSAPSANPSRPLRSKNVFCIQALAFTYLPGAGSMALAE
jgi:hypothetical protein